MTSAEKPGNNRDEAEKRTYSAGRDNPQKQAKKERLSRALKQNLMRRKSANQLTNKE